MHGTIESTVHSMPLNSLEHCICTTTITNIRPDRDSNLEHPGSKHQSIRMSHRAGHIARGVMVMVSLSHRGRPHSQGDGDRVFEPSGPATFLG